MIEVTADFETYYSKDYSLSKMTTEAYIRDPRFEAIGVAVKVGEHPTDWFSGTMAQTKDWLHAIRWDDKALIAQNTAFDAAILNWHFDIRPGFLIDTMSMARPKHAMTTGCSLKALAEAYGIGQKGDEVIHALGKRRLDFTNIELQRYGQYCINDVELTYHLWKILRQGFPKEELEVIDMVLRMFTEPVFQINKPLLEQHLVKVREDKRTLLRDAIRSVAESSPETAAHIVAERCKGKTVKDLLMSNPLFAEVLKSCGVMPPTKISLTTGKETWAFAKSDEEFKALLEHEDPTVQALVAARLGVKSTIEETRAESFIGIAERGLMPILLNYGGAHTHRLSGGDGVNPQNMGRGSPLRDSLEAPEGHTVVACDSSQIEARVTAYVAGQDDLVEAFRNNADIYSDFASDVFGRPVNRKRKEMGPDGKEFYPDFAEGFVGKTSILGLGFGMGDVKFQGTLKKGQGGFSYDMPLPQCGDVVALYRRRMHMIPKLWKASGECLKDMESGGSGTIGVGILLRYDQSGIYLPNGMVLRYPELAWRQFPKKDSQDTERQLSYIVKRGRSSKIVRIHGPKGVENIVQALARIVVFEQMLQIKRAAAALAKKYGGIWRVVLTVHDEVVAIVPTQFAAQFQRLMEKCMSVAPAWAPGLPVACEAGRGASYGSAK